MTQSTQTSSAIDSVESAQLNWRDQWYPVSFRQDLPEGKPFGFRIYDLALVLFEDEQGQLSCLKDRCPHRAARLSDGQIVNGRLECLYHGWQYDGAGDCMFIPQMVEGKHYPIRSCVENYAIAEKNGIVWVWPGEQEAADPKTIPHIPGSDAEDIIDVTFQMDLPYDQSYLIENVIDIAHIHIAHDGVRGGGLREAAKPLDFEILRSDLQGIKAKFRSIGLKRSEDEPEIGGALVEFVAPNLVCYSSQYSDKNLVAGLELYSLPMGKGRCRLLYRKFSNFAPLTERIKPRWLEHQTQCLILEQDMNVVVGQHEEIELDGRELRDIWLPIKTSDQLVIAYRKWLDEYGKNLPFYRGFATAKNSRSEPGLSKTDTSRRTLHTNICSTCKTVLRRLNVARICAAALALVFFALALLAASLGQPVIFQLVIALVSSVLFAVFGWAKSRL
jgi:phenylpropionate dioxygenase-like ring-hydroxylating dioxygenase large terminal subunit